MKTVEKFAMQHDVLRQKSNSLSDGSAQIENMPVARTGLKILIVNGRRICFSYNI